MHSTLQPSLLQVSRKLGQRSHRLIATRKSRGFHRPSKRCWPQDGVNPANPGADEPPTAEAEDSKSPKAIISVQSDLVLEKSPPKELAFYGSRGRRQLRKLSTKRSEIPSPIPEWFLACNVLLQEDSVDSDPSHTFQYTFPKGYEDALGAPWLQEKIASFKAGDPWNPDLAKEAPSNPAPAAKYMVTHAVYMEVLCTMLGLMKLPLPGFSGEFGAEKSHLILHYAREGGQSLLEELVPHLSHQLGYDVIALDAIDIAELANEFEYLENPPEDFAHASRLLSYEVYQKQNPVFDITFQEPPSAHQEAADSLEEDGEDYSENAPKAGPIPMMVARPININLADLFGSMAASGGKGRPRNGAKQFLEDNSRFSAQMQNSPKNILKGLLDAIIAAPCVKMTEREAEAEAGNAAGASESTSSTYIAKPGIQGKPLVILVKEVRKIQDTPFGGQFLRALYENVKTRRASREKIMVIGTEVASEQTRRYNQNRIEKMQRGELDEISRTIVISPVLPTARAKLQLLEDQRRRTRIINMRHLWAQYSQKDPQMTESLPPAEWQKDPRDYLDTTLHFDDWHALESSCLSFGQIHRIVSLMNGLPERLSISARLHEAMTFLRVGDRFKYEWAEAAEAKAEKQMMREASSRQNKDDAPLHEDKRMRRIRKSATKHEKRLMSGIIEPDNIRTTFDDVHAPLESLDALKTLTTLSLIRPEAFKYGVLASDKIPGLLLYGPPGTGKTLLAKAVAKESGATVLEVSAAEINDMYVGEGEKNVKALFSLAKKLTPCVIFIDEADALFSTRGGPGHRRASHRELLNQFLKEWDGMSNDAGGAFILVSTNRPFDLDDAVLRRLPRRLLVDLPAENDRLEILKIHLRDEQLADDVDLPDLASKTAYYSGSDLKNVSVAAALACVREENEQAQAHSGGEPFKYADKRTLNASHFAKALEEISASISEDMSSLKDIKKFDEQYGDKRGKKKKSNLGFGAASAMVKGGDTVKVRA